MNFKISNTLRFMLLNTALLPLVSAQAYDYTNNVPYSQQPPANIASNDVPLFVSIGFDDNGFSGMEGSGGEGGMTWILNFLEGRNNNAGNGNAATYDGTPARVTFFNTSSYLSNGNEDAYVKQA